MFSIETVETTPTVDNPEDYSTACGTSAWALEKTAASRTIQRRQRVWQCGCLSSMEA